MLLKESRLIGITLDQLNKQRQAAGINTPVNTVVNARTAQKVDVQQSDQHAAQLGLNQDTQQVVGQSGFQTATPVKNSTDLNNINTVYGNAANHASTTYNTTTGIATPTLAPSTGVIQDTERARLKASGMTDAQIAAREQQLQPQIQETMTLTGLGVQYDPKTGKVIPGSGRLPDGATRLNDQNKAGSTNANIDVSNVKGYIQTTRTNPDGSVSTWFSEDPNATIKAQQDAKNAKAAQDQANAINAQNKQDFNKANPEQVGSTGQVPTPPTPSADSFIASLPPEQQKQAQAVFGPMFDYFKQAQGLAGMQLGTGIDALNDTSNVLANYVAQQKAQDSTMYSLFKDYNEQTLQHQLDAADTAMKQQNRINELERQSTDLKYDQAIQDQVVKNEKNRRDQLLGLGITGGWRASRQTSDVIFALSQGDRIVSDLRNNKALADLGNTDKAITISENWKTSVNDAYDKNRAANLALQQQMLEHSQALDKTIFNSTTDKIKAIADLKSKYLDSIGTLYGDYAKTVQSANKFAIEQASDAAKAKVDADNKVWDHAMKYIDMYGTQNRGQLSLYESKLGLPPGSLSNQKTIEELKMKKSGGGGVGSGAGNIADLVKDERNRLQAQRPYATSKDIDQLAWFNIHALYGGGGVSGDKTMREVFKYMVGNTINGESYSIAPFSETSTIGQETMKNVETRLSDLQFLQTNGPNAANQLYRQLTGADISNPTAAEKNQMLSDSEARQVLQDYGYVDVGNVWQQHAPKFLGGGPVFQKSK